MGGLENGLVNLVNAAAFERYRHIIVCMAYASDFRLRIRRSDVEVVTMHVEKRGWRRVTGDLVRLFRKLRPDIVHSRNLSGLDSLLPATLAGVPVRVHGEHGWEMADLTGRNVKHEWLRRLHGPLIHRWVALSKHQERYLIDRIRVPSTKIAQIYNGVDTERFRPRRGKSDLSPQRGELRPGGVVIGTVLRMRPVKDPLNLVRAFIHLRRSRPELREETRLVMVGDGPLRDEAAALLTEAGDRSDTWLPGAREDIPELLRSFDVFVLPSRVEGISNTILEAMASGLPVVATRVGGNPELVLEGETGVLVPASDPPTLADALTGYIVDAERRQSHGVAGRRRAEETFSLTRMVSRYSNLYDDLLARNGRAERQQLARPAR